MKLLNRFSLQVVEGKELHIDQLLPYQYVLCEDLSSQPVLSNGTVLCKDGLSVAFGKIINANELEVNDIVTKSIIQIAKDFTKWEANVEQDKNTLPNPLVPPDLFQKSAGFTNFEEILIKVMEEKHLYQISNQPKIDIKYHEELLPTSRAKRISNRAHRYLASHSETWQERTLAGIYPKKLLAKVSDDEIAIYENKVYAKLLDKIQIYLKRRLRNLEEEKKSLDDALSIDKNEAFYFQLRNSLCKLWGQNLSPDESEELIESISETYRQNHDIYKKINNLKKIGLYPRISDKQKIIPNQLHNTNILSHDQHYRHLQRLWVELYRTTTKKETINDKIERTIAFQTSYNHYILLLLLHALEGLYFQINIEQQTYIVQRETYKILISLDNRSSCWQLQASIDEFLIGDTLTVLPYSDLVTNTKIELITKPLLLCALEIEDGIKEKNSNVVWTNPLNLESIEQLSVYLFEWLYKPIVTNYGSELAFSRMPSSIMKVLEQLTALKYVDNEYILENELSNDDVALLEEEYGKKKTNEIVEEIYNKNNKIKILKKCLICSEKVDFEPRVTNKTFVATCKKCQSKYKTKSDADGNRTFTLSPTTQDGYEKAGHWYISFGV